MAYKRFRIALSRGWTYIVCSLSVLVIALAGCRSKKVDKTVQEELSDEEFAESIEDMMVSRSRDDVAAPIVALPGDSRETREMIRQVNEMKDELSGRMNSVIYGTPEVMQRRAEENRQMRAKVDSLTNEINKARQK